MRYVITTYDDMFELSDTILQQFAEIRHKALR